MMYKSKVAVVVILVPVGTFIRRRPFDESAELVVLVFRFQTRG